MRVDPGSRVSSIVVQAAFEGAVTPRAIAEAMVGYRPWWLGLLIRVRKRGFRKVVQKVGSPDPARRLAFYEVVEESPECLVLSRDADGYFSRLIVRVGNGRLLCESVAVPKNLMGWAYLAATRPIRWLAVTGAVRHAMRLTQPRK